jgi:hypothetical protein
LIAIQARALDVDGRCTINATTVLDLARLGTVEDDEPGQATDRGYWINRGSQATVEMADRVLELVNLVTPGVALKYNKYYIGLARDGVADNFMSFQPRRGYLVAGFRIGRSDEVSALIEDSGIDTLPYEKWGNYRLRLVSKDLDTRRDLLLDLIRRASGTPAAVEESGDGASLAVG